MDEWGVGQGHLATRLGINQTYVSKIVRGHRKPSRELAGRISKETGRKVTVDQLLRYEIPAGAEIAKKRPRGRSAPKAAAEAISLAPAPEKPPETVH